jgi:hypothetical protein
MKNLKILLLISLLFCLSKTIKADTIHLTLPISAQHYCQSSGFNTFVFHKPAGFGATKWYINASTDSLYHDSIIYTPTILGVIDISCVWNSNWEGFLLNLYGSPPAHANFTVTGGTINSTKDTIWMCGSSVTVGSNTIGSQATSYAWYGPMSPNGWDDPIQLSTEGTYHFDRINPCDTTIDTFVLIKLPSVLPSFGPDTSFCNTAVSLDLDAGPGWTYDWNTGPDSQTLHVSTAGTYAVNLANLCTSGVVSITVEHQSFPLPDLLYQMGSPMCSDSVLVLNPNPSYTYDTYHWSNGATSDTLAISSANNGSGVHEVTVTKGGCSAGAYGSFDFLQVPVQPSICIVTVDAATGNNKLVWEVSETGIDSYNIYQLTSGYTLIGNVPNTPGSATLSFYDLVTNPMASAARYKITAVDIVCGIESEKSFYHGTIKINSNPGTGGVLDLTVTDQYVDESGTYIPTKYYILIDSLNNGNLTMKDSMNAVFNSYTVTNPVQGATYVISVSLPWACGAKTNFGQMSFSNKSMVYMSVDELQNNISIKIYPNPSKGIFNIEAKNISRIEVLDNLGRKVLTTNNPIIDMSKQSSGIYNARVYTKAGVGNCKLVVE